MKDTKEHWEALGHEVRYEYGASEKLAQWADIYWVDSFTNNIHYLWKLYHGVEGVSRTEDWDNNKKPMIVVRPLDWEIWLGFMRDQAIVDWVDKIIFIAPHIQKRVNSEVIIPEDKQKLIVPGVNLDRFPLKTKVTDGFQLGMNLGDEWKYKNLYGGLDIFTTLYQKDNRWRLHIRGQHENSQYDPANWEYYLESRGIKDVVTHYAHMEDINQFYENIDILLHPGQKEAFCYAVAEAMAKGIPAVINDFYGSHDIWDTNELYKTHQEAVDLLDAYRIVGHKKEPIRQYIQDHYSLEKQLQETDEFLGIKEVNKNE